MLRVLPGLKSRALLMHLNHPLEPRNPAPLVSNQVPPENNPALQVNNPALQVSSLVHPENSLVLQVSSPVLQVNNLALQVSSQALLVSSRVLQKHLKVMNLQRGTNLQKDTSPLKTTRNRVKSQGSDNFKLLPQKVATWQAGGTSGKRG